MLKQDRHQIGNHDDCQERVTKPGATGQVGSPIARVHVTDSHQKSRTSKCSQLSPKRGCAGNYDAAVDFRKRDLAGAPAPCLIRVLAGHVVRPLQRFIRFSRIRLIKLVYITLLFYSSTIIYCVDYFSINPTFRGCREKKYPIQRSAAPRPWRIIWSASSS